VRAATVFFRLGLVVAGALFGEQFVGACSPEGDNDTENGYTYGSSGSGAVVTPENGSGVVGPNSKVCASTQVSASRTPINVILVVDRSTTMGITPFGNYLTRWLAIRAALLEDPGGLVPSYQESIRFGFQGFTGFPPDSCPNVVSVPHALNNYQKILEVFDAPTTVPGFNPLGQTPTGEALKVIVDKLESVAKDELDVKSDPFYMLIATDGQPDTCAAPNAEDDPATYPEAAQSVVDQVKRAFSFGVKSYVLSVGTDTSREHLQAVANVGVNKANAPFWTASDDKGLRDALSAIIGAASSCALNLKGSITNVDKACSSGTVMLNSKKLPCSNQDGWRIVNATSIELVGASCTTYKTNLNAILTVEFPCDAVTIE
jgi:hypothetical protein